MAKHDAAIADTSEGYELIGPRGGSPNGRFMVREASSGRLLDVLGAGAMKGVGFEIDEGIDLNKPIAAQALTGTAGKTATRK